MNRLNFWSRKSKRADAAKAEAQASETPKEERPTLTKKISRKDTKEEDVEPEPTLNEAAPQEYAPEDSTKVNAKKSASEKPAQAATAQLQEEAAEADTTAPATAIEEAHQESKEDTTASADEQVKRSGPEMPGGASTDAPHTAEEVEDNGEEQVYAAGHVNEKGDVIDEEGNVIGKVEGDVDKLAGHPVDEDGDVLDDEGNIIGKAIPVGDSQHDTAATPAEQTMLDEKEADDETETSPAEGTAAAEDLKDAAAPSENQGPVLSKDDEQFLNDLTSEVEPQQPPTISRRPTEIADNGELVEPADIELPTSPSNEDGPAEEKKVEAKTTTWRDRWSQWSFVPAAPSTSYFSYRRSAPKDKKDEKSEEKDKPEEKAAEESQEKTEEKTVEESQDKPEDAAAEEVASNAAKATELAQGEDSSQKATQQDTKDVKADAQSHEAAQHRDLTHMLSNLKLSSLNNSVISISHETQHLLESFTLVLKDIVSGAPTAYDDLDKLITERQDQLDNLFGSMPPFVQTLVKSIPVKMYGALAPQVAAAMSAGDAEDTHTFSKRDVEADAASTTEDEAEVVLPFNTTTDASTSSSTNNKKSKKKKSLVPSLRSLISEKGTAAAMLRSILNFLQARFPAFITGSNVLMSVAVFILLFVFWYCHKRGKAMRLSRAQAERVAAEVSLEDLEEGTNLEESNEKARNEDVQEMRVQAAGVPLPKGEDVESKEKEKEKEAGNKDDDDDKEEQPKSLDQRAAELLSGARTAPTAEKAEPTHADDETMRKLRELQQKSVDDAAVHDADPVGEHHDDVDVDVNIPIASSTGEAPEAQTEEATYEPQIETEVHEDPAVQDADKSKDNDRDMEIQHPTASSDAKPAASSQPTADTAKAEPEAGAGQKAGQVSFADLMKALETHAKSQPKLETPSSASAGKREGEEVVDDPNEEMMAY